MRKLHPSWRHEFFCDHACRELIRTLRPDLVELYDFYPRAVQKSDLFRVVAVHELGGFYLDLDVHLFKNLDTLRDAEIILAEERAMSPEEYSRRHHCKPDDSRSYSQIANYGFGARAGHWFLAEVLDEMIRRAETVNPSTTNQDDVLFTTGPDVFSAVYARHISDLTRGFIFLRGRCNPPEPRANHSCESWAFQFGEFGNHLMASSWRTAD